MQFGSVCQRLTVRCTVSLFKRDFKKAYNVVKYLQSPQCKRGFCEFREENATSSFPVLHRPSLFNTTAGVSQTYMSKFKLWTADLEDAACQKAILTQEQVILGVLGVARRRSSWAPPAGGRPGRGPPGDVVCF